MEANWIKEFNDLFKKINNQETPSYFSGPRFICIIQEFDSTFLQYNQYIDYRKSNGLSTSRKDYFFDILSKFEPKTRKEIFARIQAEIAESDKKGENNTVYVKSFENWLNDISDLQKNKHVLNFDEWVDSQKQVAQKIEKEEPPVVTEIIDNPKVFISYSWDNPEHENWILTLAKRLRENYNINAFIDKYELRPGANMVHFMEQSIEKSDKVLIILTENYKLKADNRTGGVGYEYSILNNELYSNVTNNIKYIPILKSGSSSASVPSFMKQFIFIDMTNSDLFEEKLNELVLTIYDKPLIEIPAIGSKPVGK